MDTINKITEFINIFENELDRMDGDYRKNLFFKFQDKTILLGYLRYCFTSHKRRKGYLTHYDLISNEQEFIIRKVGRYNYLVFDEGIYEVCKEKIPEEFGIYICNYTEMRSLNGQFLKCGELKKIRPAMKVNGELCGMENINLIAVDRMFGKEIPATMAHKLEGKQVLKEMNDDLEEDIWNNSFLNCIKSDFINNKRIDYDSICDKLMVHQNVGALIAEKYNKFGFFFDTGTGKTLMALEIIAQKQRKFDTKFMIICPKTIINTAWVEDCEHFFPNMKILPLLKGVNTEYYFNLYDKWKNKGLINDSIVDDYFEKHHSITLEKAKKVLCRCADHFIVNPEAFRASPEEYINLYSTDDCFGNLKIDGIIVDESSLIRNTASKLFRTIEAQCLNMKYVYLLSGKPAPNKTDEYLAQMRIISPELYCRCITLLPENNRDYINECESDIRRNIILDQMNKISFTVSKEECLDLPKTVTVVRNVVMSAEASEIYDNIRKDTWGIVKKILEKEGEKNSDVFKCLKGSTMKLRQVSNGIINIAEEKGKTHYKDVHDKKINELMNIVYELGQSQAIIWCQFKYDIERIEKKLSEMGYHVVTAYSETEDKDKSIKSFKSGQAQFLIAHPKTLQYGVTLTNCSYAIYYSLSYSFEEYYQSHDRIYRKGQHKSCTYIFLSSKETIDELMYDVIMKKKTVVEANELILQHLQIGYSSS